ncbi:hypothetical protein [Lacticaseibacillus songhuajiangensis]|uniref:hypothetical protein n=1 Tax=Lacticaseibacillus songhuajiangensis TaxID=1296539 RepID=UPI000F79D68E|nr:hypothetical protein [Lacticaseibacillus songhuajiangensis]
MTISGWIQTVTSVVAVIIATGSLWWSIKIQRDANRPYVVATLEPVRLHSTTIIYLVIKNYGKTGAVLKNFVSDKDLGNAQRKSFKNNPFENLSGTLLAPNQSLKAGLTTKNAGVFKVDADVFNLSFDWKALDGKKFESTNFCLDLKSAMNTYYISVSPVTSGKDVSKEVNKVGRIISEASQESILNRL